MIINNINDLYKHVNVAQDNPEALEKAILFQARLPDGVSVEVNTALTGKISVTVKFNKRTSEKYRLSFPFSDEDFWKTVDDAGEEVLIEDGDDDDDDDDEWLNFFDDFEDY